MNITNTINSFVRAELQNVIFFNDLFPDDTTEGIVTRHDPSVRKIADFIDGSAIYQIAVSFNSRFSNSKTSRDTLDKILELLDGRKLTDTMDELNLKIKSNSNIQLVGTDDKNRTIYSCSVTVEYKKFN